VNFDLSKITRENVKALKAYSSARDEYTGEASVFLDANENAYGALILGNYNRYPDPYQSKIKAKLAEIKGLTHQQIFLGNGSDEAIDLLFRAFCIPAKDNVILIPPTYGMYKVAADINDIQIIDVPLNAKFEIETDKVLAAINEQTKLIFVCSPNNPSGNQIPEKEILSLLKNFQGIVVVDEAYIDFAENKSAINLLDTFPNLVILQTFSKAWGMAALRVGMAFASKDIIQLFNKIKPPYNINALSQEKVLQALKKYEKLQYSINEIKKQREFLISELKNFTFVEEIYPSDANFILISAKNATDIYNFLTGKGIIVRNRSNMQNCKSCLRITVGTPEENHELIASLKQYAS